MRPDSYFGRRHQVLRLGPFRVRSMPAQDLMDIAYERLALKRRMVLFFANTNFVVTCAPFAHEFDTSGVTIVNDGIGMDLAARWFCGERFEENLNGTDFVPRLIRQSSQSLKVFLYGAKPDIVAEAARAIERLGAQVVGALPGYGVSTEAVREQIVATQPQVVLVAMGNPLQERWILDNGPTLPEALYVGVGALFDFLSQRTTRAPMWVRRLRLEWLYRLCREPKRLWRRYTIDIVRFFRTCSKARA
jgi:beta-1,4-glucosyltransferase